MADSKYFTADDMKRVLQFIKDLEEDLKEAQLALKAGLIDEKVVQQIEEALAKQRQIRDTYK